MLENWMGWSRGAVEKTQARKLDGVVKGAVKKSQARKLDGVVKGGSGENTG